MTDKELMHMALEIMETAIKAGDWKVDGACDPDIVLNALRAKLAEPEQDGECKACNGNGCKHCDARFLNDGVIQCTPIPPKDDSGWTEWQFPIHKGYLMQCCDCGLVHEVNFKVVKKVGRTKKDGSWESEATKKGKFRVGMRMRRYE